MLFLRKSAALVLSFAFVVSNAFAALISFSANTILDLSNPPSTIYVISGSAADAITFDSDYTDATVVIPAGSIFKIGSSGSRYLSIQPASAAVTLTFRDTFIDANGYVTNWILESSSTTNVSIQIYTELANDSYAMYANSSRFGYYNTDSNGLMTFTHSLTENTSYAFQEGDPPSGSSNSSSGRTRSVQTVSLPSTTTTTITGMHGTASTSDVGESSGTLGISGAVTLAPTAGKVTQSIKLFSSDDKKLTVEIPQHTQARTASGEVFSGVIAAPKTIPKEAVSKSISGGGLRNKVHAAITVDAPGQSVRFDKLVKITIPFDIKEVQNPEKLKVFYYDKKENKYKLARDGGQISVDKKTMEVRVDHFTLFAVFETDAKEISLNIQSKIYNGIAGIPSKPGLSARASAKRASFGDVKSDVWFAPFVSELASKGIISGYPDGSYRPEQNLNRAEIVKIAMAAFDFSIPYKVDEAPFDDVSTDVWFAPFVAAAKDAGVVSGIEQKVSALTITPLLKVGSYGDGVRELQTILTELGYYSSSISGYFGNVTKQTVKNFQLEHPETGRTDGWGRVGQATLAKLAEASGRQTDEVQTVLRPGDLVNRAETLKILLLASGLELPKKASFSKFNDVSHTEWFIRYVNFAETYEIVGGFSDGSFRPGNLVNRAEAAKIVSLLLELKEKGVASAAVETPKKLSFWERFSSKNLLSGLLSVFRN